MKEKKREKMRHAGYYTQLMTREQWMELYEEEKLYMEELENLSFKWKGHTDSVKDDDAEIERLLKSLHGASADAINPSIWLHKKEKVLEFLRQVV